MSVLFHEALIVLIRKNTFAVFHTTWHEITALYIAMTDDYQYFKETLIKKTSYLKYLLHQSVDKNTNVPVTEHVQHITYVILCFTL